MKNDKKLVLNNQENDGKKCKKLVKSVQKAIKIIKN
jgi:hypothetical protein